MPSSAPAQIVWSVAGHAGALTSSEETPTVVWGDGTEGAHGGAGFPHSYDRTGVASSAGATSNCC